MADTQQLETMALDAYNRQDFAAARGLWQQSADLGSITANYNLAMLTLYGMGETPDPAKARALLTKVKNGGGDPEPLWTEMLRQEAAARPDPSAELVHEGLDAYKAGDAAKAMNLWSRASEMGNANASYNLAQLMMYGKGTPVNFVAARALLNIMSCARL